MLTMAMSATYTITSHPESWQPRKDEFRQTVRQVLPDGSSLIVELRCTAGMTQPDVVNAGIYTISDTQEGWRWSLVQTVSPEAIAVHMESLRKPAHADIRRTRDEYELRGRSS